VRWDALVSVLALAPDLLHLWQMLSDHQEGLNS